MHPFTFLWRKSYHFVLLMHIFRRFLPFSVQNWGFSFGRDQLDFFLPFLLRRKWDYSWRDRLRNRTIFSFYPFTRHIHFFLFVSPLQSIPLKSKELSRYFRLNILETSSLAFIGLTCLIKIMTFGQNFGGRTDRRSTLILVPFGNWVLIFREYDALVDWIVLFRMLVADIFKNFSWIFSQCRFLIIQLNFSWYCFAYFPHFYLF